MLYGTVVCEKTFCFASGFGRGRFDRLKKRFLKDGVIEPVHRNAGQHVAHTVSFERTKHVTFFIRNYAQEHALFLPGRQNNHFNASVKLLPTSCTKKQIYDRYVECCASQKYKPVSLVTFRTLWRELCNDIVIMERYVYEKWSQNPYNSIPNTNL